ncbi:MAG TPA: sulfotransferase family 2 domain-containing protein [Longimicrobiales bacterium]
MRISHTHSFIFFSNPKTGSESVRALLDPYSDIAGIPLWECTPEFPFYSHIRPVEVREIFRARGWDFERYYRFTFVRNPWARLVSLYHMIHPVPAGSALRRALEAARGHPSVRGFRRWIRGVRADGPGAGGPPDQRWMRYGSYSIRSYAGDRDGQLLVDRVIKLEEIDTAIPHVFEEIGLPPIENGVPRVNVRTHRSYTEYYDDATRTQVESMYAYDIAQYGYVFGE